MRDIRGRSAVVIGCLYVAFVAWSLYGAVFPVETYAFRMVHLAFIFALGFLVYPPARKAGRWAWWLDLSLAVLGVASVAYGLVDLDQFIRRSTLPDPMDVFFGLVAIVLLLELSRRAVDNTFTLVVLGFLLYVYFGRYFPGVLSHKGYEIDRIVGHMYMTLEGIFGVPLSVSVSFVILFVVYGTFMDTAGAGNFWLDLSLATMGRTAASAGRGALITTALLGGPQASGVATTMSVAPIMWPILERAGYSPNMAAGLISAGGIGAVISPPLMGAAAFLIMQFLNIPFWDVVVMVFMPTLLYYLGTFFMVEMEARKHGFKPPVAEAKTIGKVLLTKGYHLISLVVLVALLVLWNKSPEYAAMGALLTTIGTSFLSKDRSEWLTPRRIVDALIEGAKNVLPVAVLLAAAGLIVGTFTLTGLGLKISGLIMSASGGSKHIALLLALVASLLIGLSLPITATYIMTVVMVAPALVKVGVPIHVAHLLAFYFAVLSEVSPPVGLSPSAAAAVTGGNPFSSMMHAWKYALPAFLVPFFFAATRVGGNLLLVDANLPDFIVATLTSVAALFFLSIGIVGYFRGVLSVVERAFLSAGAVFMAFSPISFSVRGLVPLGVGAAIAFRNAWVHRTQPQERLADPSS
ncbi:MAG TPA: TRAP transporter fused permease subunit [Syntrophobacteria bacterium]|nr:TRAP transporter fused permease subunit [Syntrophobacteria bacterium]